MFLGSCDNPGREITTICRYLQQNLHNCFAPFLAPCNVEEGAPIGFWGPVINLDERLPRICCPAVLSAFCRYLRQSLKNCFALFLARYSVEEGAPDYFDVQMKQYRSQRQGFTSSVPHKKRYLLQSSVPVP
jgi:hypothetical protein